MAPEESQQELLTTVAMFEEVVRAQPGDYQSLEILREAYGKLGREDDVIRIAKLLAAARKNSGQLSAAIMEYEEILRRRPDDPEAKRALDLLRRQADTRPRRETPAAAARRHYTSNGDEALGRALLDAGLIMQRVYDEGIRTTREWFEAYGADPQPRLTFAQYLEEAQAVSRDELMQFFFRTTGFPYVPVDGFQVDEAIGRRMPREIALHDVVLLFDVMGRMPLVALSNPLDDSGRRRIEKALQCRPQFYVAPAADIVRQLEAVYSVAQARPETKMAEV